MLHKEFNNELRAYPTHQAVQTIGSTAYRANSADFFISDQLPQSIKSVVISFSKYNSPISCRVTLWAIPVRAAQIDVDGTDTNTVAAIFHELQRELRARETGMSKIVLLSQKKTFSSLVFHFIYSIIAAASIYSVFDVSLTLFQKLNPGFNQTLAYKTVANIGWLCVMIGFFAGGYVLNGYLAKCFPSVEFAGRLSDPSRRSRGLFLFIVFVILLPIVLNVISALIIEAMNR